MRGRTKEGNAKKRVRGTDQKIRMDKEVPASQPLTIEDVSVGRPVFPPIDQYKDVEGLTNDRQRWIYGARCKTLAAMGVMEESFQESMILYAIWLDTALTSADEMKHGSFIEVRDKDGNLTGYVENPHIKRFAMATKMVNEIGRQFGFTPLSRNNVVKVEKNIDPAGELLKLVGG